MIFIKQEGPTCLVTACAMLLDETVAQLHKELGTDGTEIINGVMRGIHIQEIQDLFIKRGYCLYPIELEPNLECNEPLPCFKHNHLARFYGHIFGYQGIIIIRENLNHACAWDGWEVYDPRGNIYPITDCTPEEVWLIGKIQQKQLRFDYETAKK